VKAFILLCLGLILLEGCEAAASSTWLGTMDTTAAGRVTVTNPAEGMWRRGAEWRVVEEMRIGAKDGDGPEVFSRVTTIAEDVGGRIWTVEDETQTIKVFDRDGRFIRKFGRKGKGPGEFVQIVGITQDRDGHIMVIDMPGGRISVYDTAGKLTRTMKLPEGFMYNPWPGVTDTAGFLIHPARRPVKNAPGLALVRYDSAMAPLDSIFPPDVREEERYLFSTPDRNMLMSVPFAPSFNWELTRFRDFWAVSTGDYKLYHLSGKGDTLRIITKPFEIVRVTQMEKDSAMVGFKWFTDQGGKVDKSKIPDVKPAVSGWHIADDGYLWIRPTLADSIVQQHTVEIFDPEGRFLGRLKLPFPLEDYPRPIIRHDRIIGMTHDEDGITYIVRAKIQRDPQKK
jgi:hypothetical protein